MALDRWVNKYARIAPSSNFIVFFFVPCKLIKQRSQQYYTPFLVGGIGFMGEIIARFSPDMESARRCARDLYVAAAIRYIQTNARTHGYEIYAYIRV